MQKIDKYRYNRRKMRIFARPTRLELTYNTLAFIKVVRMTSFTLMFLNFDTYAEIERP